MISVNIGMVGINSGRAGVGSIVIVGIMHMGGVILFIASSCIVGSIGIILYLLLPLLL